MDLVVFFSHAGENYGVGYIEKGNTCLVAEKLRDCLDADIFELVPEMPYSVSYSRCSDEALEEQKRHARPKYKNPLPSIYQYDTIYLCYPIWWGTYPQLIESFLNNYSFEGKKIVLIATHEGSGFGKSVEDVKKNAPLANVVEGFALRGTDVRTSGKIIEYWLRNNR